MAGGDHSLCRGARERGLRILDDPPPLHRYPRAFSALPMATPACGAYSWVLYQLLREAEKVSVQCGEPHRPWELLSVL